MKKNRWALSSLLAGLSVAYILGFSGCTGLDALTDGAKSTGDETILQAVSDFYESDYEYRFTDVYYEGQDVLSATIKEGKVIQEPYQEFVQILQAPGTPAWDKAYFEGTEDEEITSMLHNSAGWQTKEAVRERPAGYGKSIDFVRQGEEILEGTPVLLYEGTYEVEVDKDLTAEVTQTYYLHKDTGSLFRIETDFTDVNTQSTIAREMQENQLTQEEAAKKAADATGLTQLQMLEITNLGGTVTISKPR